MSGTKFEFVRLEDGRIIEFSGLAKGNGVLELVDGALVKPSKKVSAEALWNAKPAPEAVRSLNEVF